MGALDLCVSCRVPMVPRRPGVGVPEGFRGHAAHGLCSACYARRFPRPSRAGGRSRVSEPVVMVPAFHRYAPPPPWTDGALCAQTDPEVFFPEKGASVRAPKAVCAACPTRAACLDYALDNREQYGIWGGTTATERKAILRGRGAA